MATVPKATPMTDERMIRALPQDWVQYQEARNIDKLITLFAEDGREMTPFQPIAQGNKALHKHFEEMFRQLDPKHLEVQTTHVEVDDNIAFSLGTFKVNVKLPNGKRIDDVGKWIATMRHINNTWKIVSHCYNTDLPMTTFTM